MAASAPTLPLCHVLWACVHASLCERIGKYLHLRRARELVVRAFCLARCRAHAQPRSGLGHPASPGLGAHQCRGYVLNFLRLSLFGLGLGFSAFQVGACLFPWTCQYAGNVFSGNVGAGKHAYAPGEIWACSEIIVAFVVMYLRST